MSEKRHPIIRKFNRTIFNPITKLFAGIIFYSLVYHTGRSSGKEYSTPVVAVKKNEFIYIPLPYGVDTDWFLNVKAAAGCDIKIHGKVYFANNPEIVDASAALSMFSSKLGGALKRAKVDQFLQLKVL
jgi:deazaflavin-dependent oxidoreductase (nitroreductase family)